MSDTPLDGPSHETLANLHAMLPSFIKGLRRKQVIGKGNPASVIRPGKVCKVCGLLFDKVSMPADAEVSIVPALCKTCEPMLEEGYTALVCGEDYAIIKSDRLKDWAGQIIHISANVMEKLKHERNGSEVTIKRRDPAGEA